MAINYKITRRAQAGVKGGGSYKYQAAAIGRKVINSRDLAQIISERCTARQGDVRIVLTELSILLPEMLHKGISVQFEEIGIFSTTLVSQLKDTPEEVNGSTIKGVRIQFRADKRLKDTMRLCSFKKAKSDKSTS